MLKTNTPANRAALYLRVSTTKQDAEGTSLQTQEETCRAYAEDHGYEVVRVFTRCLHRR
jgi:DNA invertase Pin-like site-specific DNA recombinase